MTIGKTVVDFETMKKTRKVLHPGNGAREAVDRYFAEQKMVPHYDGKMSETDYMLIWLWIEGFKVVPLGPGEGSR